jgi:hypothetical protein
MTQIAIIDSTSTQQCTMVFRGVYGRLSRQSNTEDAAQTQVAFSVSPSLRPVSTVFQYLDNGAAPVQMGEYMVVDVPEKDVERVEDQLMYALQKRWRGMYKTLAPKSQSMDSMLLNGEARAVENAVDSHFAARNKTLWLVPVIATMQTESDGAYLTTPQALMNALPKHSAKNIIICEDEVPTPYVASTADVTLPAPIPDPEATAPAWGDYMGVQAQVKGHMVVVASSADDALQSAKAFVSANSNENGSMKFMTEVAPTSVLSTRPMQYTDGITFADDHNHGDNDGDENDSPREKYRF